MLEYVEGLSHEWPAIGLAVVALIFAIRIYLRQDRFRCRRNLLLG